MPNMSKGPEFGKGRMGEKLKSKVAKVRYAKEKEKLAKLPKHAQVGAVIKQNKKILLINRETYPLGFACPGGHIEKDETPAQAVKREVKEETGLDIKNAKLIFEEFLPESECDLGIKGHYWYIFECTASGWLDLNPDEAKSGELYTMSEIKKLAKAGKLDAVWAYWLKRLGVI